MSRGSLRLIRTLPTLANWRGVLKEFNPSERDIVCGLTDRAQERVGKLEVEGAPGEFVDFAELVGRGLEWSGEPRGASVAGESESAEAVARACYDLPQDSPYAKTAAYPGMRRRLHSTVRELRDQGFDPDSLSAASAALGGTLAEKLRSLALLEAQAQRILSALGKTTLSERISRGLKQSRKYRDDTPRVLIFAGSEFVPHRLEWTRHAVEIGLSATLVFDAHSNAHGLFRGSDRMIALLGGQPPMAEASSGFARCLFTNQVDDSELRVGAVSAPNPLSECEWVLRRVLPHIGAGHRASSIAVYCRSLEEYGPLLATAATRLQVPLDLPWREPLVANGLVRWTLTCIAALSTDSPLNLSPVLDSSSLGMSKTEKSSFQAAIREASFHSEDPWSFPALDSGTDPNFGKLADLLRWREASIGRELSLAGWIGRLDELLSLDWLGRDSSSAIGDRDRAARAALIEALSTRAAIEGAVSEPPKVSLAGFVEILRSTAAQASSAPWSTGKGVRVATRSEALGEVDHLFVLGMLEGVFPRRRTEDAVLSDFEREATSAANPDRPFLPNSHDRARSERDELVAVCAAATKSITFAYPQTEEERDNVPAFYLSEAKRAAGDKWRESTHARNQLIPDETDCLAASDAALARALKLGGKRALPNLLSTAKGREAVRGLEDRPISPSEFRDVSVCPFQYAFRRKLELRTSHPENPWGRLRHLPQDVGLPAISSPEDAKQRLCEALDAEVESLRGEISAAEAKLMRAGGRRLIRDWVKREFQAREIWPKDPGSVRPHAAFGKEGLAGELPLKGRTIRLRGAATAVSTMGEYSVAQLANARRSLAESSAENMEPEDKLELGLYMWALSGSKPGTAVEAESMGGQRTLFLLPRFQEQQPEARQGEGLKVVAFDDKREFFTEVKELLEDAVEKLDSADVTACPGDHCRYCDYGEICRNAQGYAEEEAAPELEDESD